MSISTVPARFAASILDRQPLSIDAADRGSRNVKLRWQIGSNPDGGIVYAELTASHSPRAKQFYATVNRVTLEPPRDGSPLRTETYWPMDNVRLPVTAPAARYSAAKLRLFVADAIVALSREVEADADRKLLRHFRPAGVA